jgi:glycosyltransferase involved in cell wall biosynthesis
MCGKPIVATDVGETRNIIRNIKGSCGRLIPNYKGVELVTILQNEIKDIYKNYNEILSNKDAFRYAQNSFDVKSMVKKYLSIFKDIIN